jgi:hypothetical protein
MSVADAEDVLETQDSYIRNEMHAPPIDPGLLDTLPNQPQEYEDEDEDEDY